MKYKVLKEFLTVKNPRWLNPGEIIDAQPSGARICALLEKGYIEMVPEQPKTVDDLKEGDKYYSISSDGFITTEIYRLETQYEDGQRIALGNAFLTRKEAEKELARRKAETILKRDTKGFKPDWNDRLQSKFHVAYFAEAHRLSYAWTTSINDGLIYFASEEDVMESINKHSREWKRVLGVEYDG